MLRVSGKGGSRRGLVVVPLLAALALACPAPAAAKPPPEFVGLVSEDLLAADPAYRDATLARQARLGVQVIRQTFDWRQIEQGLDQHDFAMHDALVLNAARHGITILPVLFNAPWYRSSAPASGARAGTYPPRTFPDFGRFAARLAERYGPRGTLWVRHPYVARRPITLWQVWNEPNLRAYWPAGPNARQYVRMLRAVRRGLRTVDPKAEVVTGGIPDSRHGVPLKRYLRALYRYGLRRHADVVAVHPYARNTRELYRIVRRARAIMNRHRHRRGELWLTEVGWSDTGPKSRYRVGRRGQAREISRLFRTLGRKRKRLRLRGIVYYGWRDLPPYPPTYRDMWGLHTGLLDIRSRPKPAYRAFRAAVRRIR